MTDGEDLMAEPRPQMYPPPIRRTERQDWAKLSREDRLDVDRVLDDGWPPEACSDRTQAYLRRYWHS